MMRKFIWIADKDMDDTVVINIDQIVWFNMNTRTIMLSVPSDKGLFHTDEESMGRLFERIKEKYE